MLVGQARPTGRDPVSAYPFRRMIAVNAAPTLLRVELKAKVVLREPAQVGSAVLAISGPVAGVLATRVQVTAAES